MTDHRKAAKAYQAADRLVEHRVYPLPAVQPRRSHPLAVFLFWAGAGLLLAGLIAAWCGQ